MNIYMTKIKGYYLGTILMVYANTRNEALLQIQEICEELNLTEQNSTITEATLSIVGAEKVA